MRTIEIDVNNNEATIRSASSFEYNFTSLDLLHVTHHFEYAYKKNDKTIDVIISILFVRTINNLSIDSDNAIVTKAKAASKRFVKSIQEFMKTYQEFGSSILTNAYIYADINCRKNAIIKKR